MSAHLIDTNILLRSSDADSPSYQKTRDCISNLLSAGEEFWIAPQNTVEFWAVATRPSSVNGLGWDTSKAEIEVQEIIARFGLLPESAEVFPRWRQLVAEKKIQGKRTHDARLVAVMLVSGISRLVTLNPSDFVGFPEITVFSPH
jgi:predicted nucleic acid-binding protein